MNPLLFAFLAAGSFGLWTVFHKLASSYVNQIFGAILVSVAAVIVGTIVLLFKAKEISLVISPKGLLFIGLAGACAFLIDVFALQAYSQGLSISIGAPIIIGGSMAIAVAIGFIFGEPIILPKILGILLIGIGGAVLGVVAK